MKSGILVTVVFSFILAGCANPLLHTINNSNESFEKNKFPFRYIETEKDKTHTTFQLEPAGIPQQTIASSSELLLKDIFKGLKEKCNFKKEDMVETRKVSSDIPYYYEVWVFNDELSKRSDKRSSISIVLKQYPNGGGVDIFLLGECHSVPKQFTFGN
ncbi:hypothetical protein [Shewanella polaris]|uniref:Lipoprotein n=1 Tax=Shewanella polaris TaxID=2588449 RepID=A0A4Y5YEJ9_9GAMM|nr:hypothetical protein [Shewanella polaris]QDE30946.1 hypothetical protein FH971_08185 [Shewanella polaris]